MAWSFPKCSNLIKGNGAFFLARKAFDSNDQAGLNEMREMLSGLANLPNAGPVVIYDCGVVNFWMNRYNDAEIMFDRATAFDEVKSGALYMLSILRLNGGDLVGALASCKACIEFDPTFSKAALIESKAALQLEVDPEQKLNLLKHAIGSLNNVSEPYFGETAFLLGRCYSGLFALSRHPGMCRAAVEYFRKCLQQNYRDSVLARIYLGFALLDVAVGRFAYHFALFWVLFFPLPPLHSLFSCDVCSDRIAGVRFHCSKCGDYDMCVKCKEAHGHEHPLQQFDFDANVAPLLEECEQVVLIGLQEFEPDAKSLEDCSKSAHAGCANQAKAFLARLELFTRKS
jgi:tetratricopeptide (TPR) repeat protein